jgi:hypothetical protein
VRPGVVVVLPPGVQRPLGVLETREPVLREALSPHGPIERLDEAVVQHVFAELPTARSFDDVDALLPDRIHLRKDADS